MNTKTMKTLVVGVAAGLMAGSAFAQGEMPPPEQMPQQQQMPTQEQAQLEPFESQASQKVVEQVRQVARQYQQAWNAHDADAIAKLYTKDATYMNSSGQTATGTNEIRDLVRQEHQGPAKGTQVMINVESVRALTPNLVLIDAELMAQGGTAEMPKQLHSTTVAVKQGNQWKIQAVRSFPSPHLMQQGVGGAGEQGVPTNEPEPRPYEQVPGGADGGSMDQPILE